MNAPLSIYEDPEAARELSEVELEPRTYAEVSGEALTMGEALATLTAAASRIAWLAAEDPDHATAWFDRIVEAQEAADEAIRQARRSIVRNAERRQDESLQRILKFWKTV